MLSSNADIFVKYRENEGAIKKNLKLERDLERPLYLYATLVTAIGSLCGRCTVSVQLPSRAPERYSLSAVPRENELLKKELEIVIGIIYLWHYRLARRVDGKGNS